MALTHVLKPLRIADVEIRNRVVRTAHGTLLGGGGITDDLIAYHVAASGCRSSKFSASTGRHLQRSTPFCRVSTKAIAGWSMRFVRLA